MTSYIKLDSQSGLLLMMRQGRGLVLGSFQVIGWVTLLDTYSYVLLSSTVVSSFVYIFDLKFEALFQGYHYKLQLTAGQRQPRCMESGTLSGNDI